MAIIRLEKSGRMSQVSIQGDMIYLAGQVGQGDSITTQTLDALSEAERLLTLAGSDKSHILSATIWLAHMDDFEAMNVIWDAWVDPEHPPSRACAEAKLATPEYLVEFIFVAAKKG